MDVRLFSAAFLLSLLCGALTVVGCSSDPEQAKLAHLQRGNELAARKEYRQAIIEYRNALRYDARYGEARLRLGEAYSATGAKDRAVAELVRAADLMPDSAEAQIKAGNALLVTGAFIDAEARADAVLRRHGQTADALLLKGYALAGLKQTDEAVEQIEEALRLNPGATRVRTNLGTLLLRDGDTEAAESTFKRAIELAPDSIDARLALGQFYWGVGRLPDAEAVLREAVAMQPGHLVANRALAAFYLSVGRAPDAEPHVKVLAQQGTAGALVLADYYVATGRDAAARDVLDSVAGDATAAGTSAMVRKAALDYAAGNHQAAHATLDAVLRRAPKHVEALVLKARFHLAEKRLPDALQVAQSAVAADNAAMAAHYTLGLVQLALEDRPAAAASFTAALKINPRAADVQTELAALQLESGKPAPALALAEAARRNAPRNRDAHLVLVKSLVARGEADRATREVQALLAANGDWAPAHATHGLIELKKQNYAGATAAFEQALRLAPDSVEALQGLVSVMVVSKRLPEGRALIERRIAASPNNADLLVLLAELDIAERNFPAAEQRFLRVLEINRQHLAAYSRLAQIYATQGRLADAQRKYEELVARQPSNVVAQTMIAVLLEVQGRPDEAITHYDRALRIDARSAVAANNLAWMYAERGVQLDQALQLAQTAKQELPDVTGVTDTLGWVYYKRNQTSQAIAAFEEITRAEPRNAAYHYRLGLAYSKAGDTEKARRALQEALKLQADFPEADDARKVLATLSNAS